MHQTPQDMVDAGKELLFDHPIIAVPTKLPDWGQIAIGAGILWVLFKSTKLLLGVGVVYLVLKDKDIV